LHRLRQRLRYRPSGVRTLLSRIMANTVFSLRTCPANADNKKPPSHTRDGGVSYTPAVPPLLVASSATHSADTGRPLSSDIPLPHNGGVPGAAYWDILPVRSATPGSIHSLRCYRLFSIPPALYNPLREVLVPIEVISLFSCYTYYPSTACSVNNPK
jgi:hypothetical protein